MRPVVEGRQFNPSCSGRGPRAVYDVAELTDDGHGLAGGGMDQPPPACRPCSDPTRRRPPEKPSRRKTALACLPKPMRVWLASSCVCSGQRRDLPRRGLSSARKTHPEGSYTGEKWPLRADPLQGSELWTAVFGLAAPYSRNARAWFSHAIVLHLLPFGPRTFFRPCPSRPSNTKETPDE